MKKIYFLFLCCFGIVSTSIAQTTITTKLGSGKVKPVYTYDKTIYKPTISTDITLALSLNKDITNHFTIITEIGFHTFTSSMGLKYDNKYIYGLHQYQQAYLAVAPQFFLTKKPVRPFLNGGLILMIDTKNELVDGYSNIRPNESGIL